MGKLKDSKVVIEPPTYPEKKTDKDNQYVLGYPTTTKYPSSTSVYPEKKKKRTSHPTTPSYPVETPKDDYSKDQYKVKDYLPTSTTVKKSKNRKPKYQTTPGKGEEDGSDCDESKTTSNRKNL